MIVLLLLAACCVPAFAQDGACLDVRVAGITRDAQAVVRLWPVNETCVVEHSGRAVFAALPAGHYRVTVVAEGFSEQDTSLDLGAGEHVTLSLLLEPVAATLSEVVVTGTKGQGFTRRFDRKEIESGSARTLPDFLRETAHLDIQSDGTAGGMQSARIGGSQTEHVLVFVDGRRLEHAGSGVADLSVIPLEWVESVEVTRGSLPEYGGEAVGGILNVTTRNGSTGHFTAGTEVHPSFARGGLLRSGRVGRLSTLVSLVRTQGPGDFAYRICADDGTGPFTVNLGKRFRRGNAAVTRDQVLVKLATGFGHAGSIEVSGTLDNAERGMPGYLAPQLTPLAQQRTRQEVLALRTDYRTGTLALWSQASVQMDRRDYENPDPLSIVRDNRESGGRWSLSGQASVDAGGRGLSAGWEANRVTLRSENIAEGQAQRDCAALWSRGRWTILSGRQHGLSVVARPGARWERFGADDVFLPHASVGLAWSRAPHTTLDVTVGKSYHAPTLYSLFWLDDQLAQGNPDLRPELSREITGRLVAEKLPLFETHVDLSVSDQWVEDLIVWRQSFDNRWKPFNLKRARVRELDIGLEQPVFSERLRVSGGANWLEARNATDDRNTGGKYLPFRPPRSQRLGLLAHSYGFDLTAHIRWVSARPALETNSKWLAAYRYASARLAYTFHMKHVRIEPAVGVNNALDEDYRLIRFAPMPVREWFAAIHFAQP